MSAEARAGRTRLDEQFMSRALLAARSGDPGPSPHAGAVLARGSVLIARAHRRRVDSPDAAQLVLARAGGRARGCTLYTTLDPRASLAAILAAGVTRVVVGCADPRAHRLGSYRRLRAAGVEVVSGVLEAQAEQLIADFRKFHTQGLPFVTLKAAVTLDGRTAARSGESKWITGAPARKYAHRLRVQCDAVLVGIGTVLADDPELTVRAVRGRNPLRVVLDSQLRTPLGAKLVSTARQVPTLILHSASASPTKAAKLRAAGVALAIIPQARRGRGLDSTAALRELAARNVARLLVEGGAHVHAALLEAGLVDRAAVFVAPLILADASGVPLAAGTAARTLQDAFRLAQPTVIRCGNDVLFQGDLERPDNPRRTRRLSRTAGPRQTTKV